jgi:hypothetical protein
MERREACVARVSKADLVTEPLRLLLLISLTGLWVRLWVCEGPVTYDAQLRRKAICLRNQVVSYGWPSWVFCSSACWSPRALLRRSASTPTDPLRGSDGRSPEV